MIPKSSSISKTFHISKSSETNADEEDDIRLVSRVNGSTRDPKNKRFLLVSVGLVVVAAAAAVVDEAEAFEEAAAAAVAEDGFMLLLLL